MRAKSNGKPQVTPTNASASVDSRPPSDWIAQVFARLEWPLVTYVRRRVGGDLGTAQDVVQESFVKLCQQPWPDIEDHATAWLYRTCRNRAIDISRREGRMSAIQSGQDVTTLDDRAGHRPDERASQGEQIDRMKSHIDDLPDRQQEILRLRLQDGLSYQQIADVTGLTRTNVGYLLHQAISALRAGMRVE
jgi:RNA polymerase sigma factor (sigma-70 family)